MAMYFDTAALEELETMLLQNADAAEKYAGDMLKAGGEVIAAAQNKALERMQFSNRSTGDLAGSVRVGKVRKTKNGTGFSLTVYPHGYQTHGFTRRGQRSLVSNAHAAFMLEYGTANMPARPWRDMANLEATDAAHEAMRKVWEKVTSG